MRLQRFLGRLGLSVALTGLTAIGAAAPAQAADPEVPAVELVVPQTVVATDGSTPKSVSFEVANSGSTSVTGLVVDFTGIAQIVGFKPPQGCTTQRCTVGTLAAGARKSYTFTVAPAAGFPKRGQSFGLFLNNGGRWQKSTFITVLRNEDGADLEIASISDIPLKAGASAALPISVRNNGDKAVDGVAVVLTDWRYITFPDCGWEVDLGYYVCGFDVVLQPGEAFTATDVRVQAKANAPGPADYPITAYPLAAGGDSESPQLKADAKAAAAEWVDGTTFLVKVPTNPADSVAIGDDFTGKIGDTRSITVGFRNDGPAAHPDAGTSQWEATSKVRIPSGIKLAEVDQSCVPIKNGKPDYDHPGQISGHDYQCSDVPLSPGEKALFEFTGKIEKGGAAGSITVDGGPQDRKTSNNVAKIEVKVLGSGQTGGETGGHGGGLPITGAPAALVAGLGVLLLAAGAATLLLTRRRNA